MGYTWYTQWEQNAKPWSLPGSSWTNCLRVFSLFIESSIFDISTKTEYISRVKSGSVRFNLMRKLTNKLTRFKVY